MEFGECIKAIHLAKMHDKERPLILRYWGDIAPLTCTPYHLLDTLPMRPSRKQLVSAVQSSRPSSADECSRNWCRENSQQRSQLSIVPQLTEIDQEASGARNAQNSEIALLSTIRTELEQPSAQKRAHSTTPAEEERIWRILRTQLNQYQNEGEVMMRADAFPALHTGSSGTRYSWT